MTERQRRRERDPELLSRVRHLFEVERLSQRQIAESLGIARKTVARLLGPAESLPKRLQPTVLAPYTRLIAEWYERHPRLKAIVAKTKEIIRAHRGEQTAAMIGKLNPVIRGWAGYHRHVCSSAAFTWVDSRIFGQLWRWARRRHTAKGKRWTRKHYFRSTATTLWQFFATVKGKTGPRRIVDLQRAGSVNILRHVKVRGTANPYDRNQDEYFRGRAARGWARLHPLQAGCTI